MTRHIATPTDLTDTIAKARPGDLITLSDGTYGPVEFTGLTGPLTIQGSPNAVFDGGQRRQNFDKRANDEARRVQDEGEYPGLYEIALEGHVILRNCRDITLAGLNFRGCWPTCIAIEDCRNIELSQIDFREGTYAIYASGASTRGLLVEHCSFVQDISENDMWRDIDWAAIHGGQPVADTDVRALDGDFLRAFGIAGDVIVRHCTIRHTFNGVHIFHSDENGVGSHVNRNVHIHDNRFEFIRDNAVEPEWGATNWWVFHNDIRNCHKVFSVECVRMGPSYFVGNTYWFDEKPTPGLDHNGGAVWKLNHDSRGGEGLNYVLHNSYYLRSKYIKKERWVGLQHVNNAIAYCAEEVHGEGICDPDQSIFGKIANKDETKQFAWDWAGLDIRFVGDMSNHRQFPDDLIAADYNLEHATAADPGFADAPAGDFRLTGGAAAIGAAVGFDVVLPDGGIWSLPPGGDVGAWQAGRRIAMPAQAYGSWPVTDAAATVGA
ncbi:MAG: hypothetical protein ACWA5A_10150 [Marinibacterium sp.]